MKNKSEKTSTKNKAAKSIVMVVLSAVAMFLFYKLPGIIADKISYRQLMKKNYGNRK